MAYTTPRTWTTGETVTAAMLNEQIRDNENFISTHTHTGAAGDGAQAIGTAALPVRPITEGCRAYHSTTQNINNAAAALAFDSERYDVGALHDISTNNSRITLAVAGVYVVGAMFAGSVNASAYIRLGGTAVIAYLANGPTTSVHVYGGGGIYSFSAGNYIEVYVDNTGGGSVNYSQQEFWAQRIG